MRGKHYGCICYDRRALSHNSLVREEDLRCQGKHVYFIGMKARLSRDLPMHKHSPSSLDSVVNEIIASGEMLKDVHLFRIVHVNNEMFGIFRKILAV